MSEADLGSTAEEVLSALSEIIVLVDADFRIGAINRSESPVFLRVPAPGDRLEEVFAAKAMEVIAGLIHKAHRTGEAAAEYDNGPEQFWITARRLESAPRTLLVFQDRTSLRHAEQALADLVKDRGSFLESISHQLRTPLTVVLGYASLLAGPNPHLDETTRSAMAHDISDQAWDLAGIVEDLLTVARSEIGELRVVSVPVNLAANAAQIIESMGDQGRYVMVTGDMTVTGVGDPARFRQIVRNLLRNALTHGSEPVTVEVDSDETYAVLRVRDRGPGVPDMLVESIFNRYVTGRDENTPGGVGIGLWICRELTSLMGGHLTYWREPDETVFQATIPLLDGIPNQ
ncbi:MAG: HAMP domain-containing sensor histidine kinase [Acidimicrobiia bacterium]